MPPTAFLNAAPSQKYADQVRAGNMFFGCNTALQALSVNSATATGLILTNPLTSGVNIEIVEICVALASPPAAQSNLILTGTLLTTAAAATTHTLALITKNCLIGSAFPAAQGLLDVQATVPTPAAIRSIGGGPVAAASISPGFIRDILDGLLQLAPGCVISLQAMTTAITVLASITWREVPV